MTDEELRRAQEIADLRGIMSTRDGRRFVWRFLGEAKVFHPCFVAGASDTTNFNEGSRELGLLFLREIMAECPGSYLAMQKEAMADEQRRKKTNRSPDSDDIFNDGE